MEEELRILILEDSSTDAELEEHELRKAGLVFTLKVVDRKEAFLKALDEFSPDLILSDYELPTFDGLAALRIAQEQCPDVPFILVTGKRGEEFVIEKLKEGATDYVLKGNLKRLFPAVERALEEAAERAKLKQMEDALLLSETRYRRLFETAKDGIILLNPDTGQIEDVNPYLIEMLGYSHEEFLGKKLWEIGPFKDIAESKRLYVELQDKEYVRYEHLPLQTKDRKQIEVEFVSNVYPIDHTKIIQCNIRNITNRKRAEEELRQSNEFTEKLMANSYDCIKLLDLEGNLIYISKGGQNLLEIEDVASVLNQSWVDFWKGEDTLKATEAISKATQGLIGQFEGYHPTQKGIPKYWDVIISPIYDKNGKVIQLLTISRDITEHKRNVDEIIRLNAELEQRVKNRTALLEAANKALENFSHSVSHDLRAPLRHIMSFVEMLKDRTTQSLDEESKHYMNVILGSTKNMDKMITDILSFSQIGYAETINTKVNLNQIVEEAINTMEEETKGRDIVWEIGQLQEVYGDPAMLQLAFINLISNALKFTRPRPQAIIEVGCTDSEKETNFFVKDNGVGFDMQYADKLFGLFKRLHKADQFEGNGVGLANVRQIIQRYGGRVWAESKVDEGATFNFSLPKGN